MKKVVIAGTSSGVGKTTLSIGLMRAIKNRNLKVQPFKIGPDYIDTAYHSFAANRKSRNLDSYMLTEEKIKYLFNKNSKNSDISIVEGVMGLYDGYGTDIDSHSTSYMSKLLKAPVILVIDGSNMSSSAAALVLGYKSIDEDVNLKGVIVNKLSSESHFNLIKESVEKYTGVKVLGYMPKNLDFSIESRHLGLIQALEMQDLDSKLDSLANELEKYIDIDEVVKISESEELKSTFEVNLKSYEGITLGVAYDKAFNFYYEDNIDLLEELGVNVVKFSPLKDSQIPNCDALYIGGGYPEVFANDLEKNISMRESIKKAYEQGMPIYAECGGLMYLGEAIEDLNGNIYEMTKVLAGKSKMTKNLQSFGYCVGIAKEDNLIAKKDNRILGHEFHHSKFISNEKSVYYMKKENLQGEEIKSWNGGYSKGNVLASYLHIHFYNNLDVVSNFLDKTYEKIRY
ncbi:cobyrinic acid a,c-diamide synthase [Clostridium cavendishii DSM 21758]|uniref:Cobyrinate a,c-diamide synthase n=1 Tax=Clostridium cavendishii DSM 21758 TaxID=1121302 RepID=A0A1M6T8P0_9CLOT|nr:cobyrinate a,c-diamide synthase [Clostridium cavendishii]SHK53256.1 cobyrinic acid a,c-diamide synthase [Clostridium cavendishii DSM 21758]